MSMTQPELRDLPRSMQGPNGLFDPLNIGPRDMTRKHIARGLSNINRWCGTSDRLMTVARHSVLVSYLVLPEYALDGLLHDAHEALTSDVPSPIKAIAGKAWRDVEDVISGEVRKWAGCRIRMPKAVKEADAAAYHYEAILCFNNPSAALRFEYATETPDEHEVSAAEETAGIITSMFAGYNIWLPEKYSYEQYDYRRFMSRWEELIPTKEVLQ